MMFLAAVLAAAAQAAAQAPPPEPQASPDLKRYLTCPQEGRVIPAPVARELGVQPRPVVRRLGELPDAHQIRLVWRDHCQEADVVRYYVTRSRR